MGTGMDADFGGEEGCGPVGIRGDADSSIDGWVSVEDLVSWDDHVPGSVEVHRTTTPGTRRSLGPLVPVLERLDEHLMPADP